MNITYHIIDRYEGMVIEIGVYATRKEAKKAMKRYCENCDWECDCEIVERDEGEEEI